VGCGTGILTNILSRYVADIIGVDPSGDSIRIAREYNQGIANASFECSNVEIYGTKHDEHFDFALAHMSLQSIENLSGAMEAISASLRPERWFLFTIPHPCFWALVKSNFPRDAFQYNLPSSHLIPFTVGLDQNPLPNHIPYYHRPLEIYSEALKEAGFATVSLREPFPSPELMKQYLRPWIYPGFILWLCRKGTDEEVK
jgi:SAM-dependent methyltransferase